MRKYVKIISLNNRTFLGTNLDKSCQIVANRVKSLRLQYVAQNDYFVKSLQIVSNRCIS